MGFKVLVMGTGAQGRVLAYLFDKDNDVDEIHWAGRRPHVVEEYCKKLEKAKPFKANATNVDEMVEAAKGVDVLINAVVPELNLYVLDAALKAGVHYIDMAFGPPYENLDKELEKSEDFKKKDLVAVTSAGLTPGTTNILAAYAADNMDSVELIKIVDAEWVDADIPISTWSPETFLADCLMPAFLYDGELKQVPPFSEFEVIDFPEIGPQNVCHHAHEEVVTLWRFIGKPVKRVEFKIAGVDLIYQLYKLGLLNKEKIKVGDVEVSPLDVYLSVVPRPPTPEQLKKWVEKGLLRDAKEVCLVKTTGYKGDQFLDYTFYTFSPPFKELLEKCPPANHSSYLVSTSAYILAKMIYNGDLKTKGVVVPEALTREEREVYIKMNGKLDPPVRIEMTLKSDISK